MKKLNPKFLFSLLALFALGVNVYAGYIPTQGGVLNRDPVNEPGFQTLNEDAPIQQQFESDYTFVKNNPINNTDFSGLKVRANTDKTNCTVTFTVNITLYHANKNRAKS